MSTIINTSRPPTLSNPSYSRVTDNSLSMPIATLSANGKRLAFAAIPRTPSQFLPNEISCDEEAVEIEISPVLPSTPNTASSVSTSKSARIRVKSLFTGVAYSVKATWDRARSSRK
ncbi:hypothetical protein TRAPUB_3048 [Trametes pubescens]|uniref:Uncharacterized protein n=1 Tax=Trametes pubescens TaxID=154538 RepID=A0A1M2VF09_TRAPU|nr:hypothetical protein TRAPUB_3048 [Trametes pubescens]